MKRPVSLAVGILVLIFAILGFARYFKDHPFKLQKPSSDGNSNIVEENIKGDYLVCSDKSGEGTETMYMEFENGIIKTNAIGSFEAPVNFKKFTKEEYEKELQFLCSGDDDDKKGLLYDCNIEWSSKSVKVIGKAIIPDEYIGLNKTEVELKMKEDNSDVVCHNATSAPKLGTGNNPIKNQVITDNSYVNTKVETSDNDSNNDGKSQTSNSHKKFCLDWYASGGSDVSLSFVFYCDKNVVQKSVDVKISAYFNENNLFGKNQGSYTSADAEREFRNRYCGKISDCDISWDEHKTYITLTGTCKSNYAGLPKSTVEEFRSGWDITTALNEICE